MAEMRTRGKAIYENEILPSLDEKADKGRFVFIDVDSGDYEVGGYDMEAINDLVKRRPDALLWMKRVGYDAPTIIDDPLGKLLGASFKTVSQIRGVKGQLAEGRKAAAIYDEKILPTLNAESDKGRFVFIDARSGDYEMGGYEIGDNDWAAVMKLLKRRPDASLWAERVGCDTPWLTDDMHTRLFGALVKADSNDDQRNGTHNGSIRSYHGQGARRGDCAELARSE